METGINTVIDELSFAQKEHHKWKMFALVSSILVVLLVGANVYLGIRFFNQPKMVEAKSALEPGGLALNDHSCKILSSAGERLDGKDLSSIPKGSFFTPECFGANQN